MQIYVVIPTYNRRTYTKNCLESLLKQSDKNLKIIVVDDGSIDGTADMIDKKFKDVVLLRGDGTLWWVGATNKGVRYVLEVCNPDDCVLLLNDDLVVPKDYIARFQKLWVTFPDTLIGSVVTDIHNRGIILSGGKDKLDDCEIPQFE